MGNRINKVRKRTIITALIATIILILGSGLFFLVGDSKSINSPLDLIVVAIMVLGVIAFLFVLFKKLKGNKYADQLNNDYGIVFEEIQEYIGVSGLSLWEKRELTDEILNLFLEAQEDGRDINEVTGEDYRAFVDELIQAYGVKNYLLYDLLTGVQFFIFYLVAVQLLLYLEQMGKAGTSFFDIKVDYTLIFFFILSAFVAIPALYHIKRRELQDFSSSSLLIKFGAVIGIFACFFFFIRLVRLLFGHLQLVSRFLNGSMVIIGSPVILLGMLILFGLIFYLKGKLRG